jgi:hypothetical protein
MHKLEYKNKTYFLDGKILTPEKSQKVYNHSPDGFNHGYSGSGPAQLALAIMLELTGKPDGCQEFKRKFIAGLPQGKDFELEFDLIGNIHFIEGWKNN